MSYVIKIFYEVTSKNIYFWCSRGEIKPIIHKKGQFFFLFNAKNAVLTLKIRRATKNGAKNETTFWVKRTTLRAFGTCDVYARFK